MRAFAVLTLTLTAGCFGSFSSDRSPTGVDLPGDPAPPTPPPPVAPTLGPITSLTLTVPGTLTIGGTAQVAVTARDAEGRVVPLTHGQFDVFASPATVGQLSDGLLLTGVSTGIVTVQGYMRDGSATASRAVRVGP